MFGTFSGASAGTSPSAQADTSGLGKPHAVETEQSSFMAFKPKEQLGTKPKKEGAAHGDRPAKESHDPSDGAGDINSSGFNDGANPLALVQQNPSQVEEKVNRANCGPHAGGDSAQIDRSGTLGVERKFDRSSQTGYAQQNLYGNPTGLENGGLNNQRRPDTLEQGKLKNSARNFEQADGDFPAHVRSDLIGHPETSEFEEPKSQFSTTARTNPNPHDTTAANPHEDTNKNRPKSLDQTKPYNSPQAIEQACFGAPAYIEGDVIGHSDTRVFEKNSSQSSKVGHTTRHEFDNSGDFNADGGIFDEMAFQAIGESKIGLAKCGHPVSIEASCAECERRLFGWAKDIKDNMPDSGVNPPPRRI